ncbi:MAG: NAD(P)H-dependent oxidoreductase [Caulobacteraceae bacterium]
MTANNATAENLVLLLLAHPALDRSRANRAMIQAAETVAGVTVRDLYEIYPTYLVDVDDEQALLKAHKVVALQFPLYWYSTPALMKEWIDNVLRHGFAYGRGGDALKGKTFFVACSSGSPDTDYQPGGSHHYSMEEFLRPLERTAALCGMHWAPPFILHESRLRDAVSLADAVETYRARLQDLIGAARG